MEDNHSLHMALDSHNLHMSRQGFTEIPFGWISLGNHLSTIQPGVPGGLHAATGCPQPPGKLPPYPGQADSGRDLVGHILPVDVAHSGAGDVLHAAPTHPHL